MLSPAMLRLDSTGEAGLPRKQRSEQRHLEGVAAAELPGWEVPAGGPGGDSLQVERLPRQQRLPPANRVLRPRGDPQ